MTAATDTASDLRQIGASIDAPLGREFVVHVDGSWRKTNDLEVPGYALSDGLRAELLAEAAEHADEPEEAEELIEAANVRGIVENSDTETWSAGAGVSWIGERATLGVSSVDPVSTTTISSTRPATLCRQRSRKPASSRAITHSDSCGAGAFDRRRALLFLALPLRRFVFAKPLVDSVTHVIESRLGRLVERLGRDIGNDLAREPSLENAPPVNRLHEQIVVF